MGQQRFEDYIPKSGIAAFQRTTGSLLQVTWTRRRRSSSEIKLILCTHTWATSTSLKGMQHANQSNRGISHRFNHKTLASLDSCVAYSGFSPLLLRGRSNHRIFEILTGLAITGPSFAYESLLTRFDGTAFSSVKPIHAKARHNLSMIPCFASDLLHFCVSKINHSIVCRILLPPLYTFGYISIELDYGEN